MIIRNTKCGLLFIWMFATMPGTLTAWLSVMLQLPDPDPASRRQAGEILHRVSQTMIDTPYYYGSFIQLCFSLVMHEK